MSFDFCGKWVSYETSMDEGYTWEPQVGWEASFKLQLDIRSDGTCTCLCFSNPCEDHWEYDNDAILIINNNALIFTELKGIPTVIFPMDELSNGYALIRMKRYWE